MAKLSKILLGLFATGYSDANYETVSCNNDESVSFTLDKNSWATFKENKVQNYNYVLITYF